MQSILKDSSWFFKLIFLLLSSWFVASMAVSFTSTLFWSAPKPPEVKIKPPVNKVINSIIPLINVPNQENEEPVSVAVIEPKVINNSIVESNIPVKLIGTVLSNNPKWSLAVIKFNDNGKRKNLAVGDSILDDIKIHKIKQREVIVNNNNQLESIKISQKRNFTNSREMVNPTAGRRQKRSNTENNFIRQMSEDKYAISRDGLDKQMADMGGLLRNIRVAPYSKNGNIVGFKIVSLKSNSVFTNLGLKRGDVINKISGYELNSVEKGLEIFDLLKKSPNFSVELNRKGQNRNFNYTVQ